MTTLTTPPRVETSTALGRRSRHLMVVYLGKQAYALPLECVRRVEMVAQTVRPPDCPDISEGFLNIAGELVPLVRLDRLVSSAPITPGLFTPMVLLGTGRDTLALLVERIDKVTNIAADEVMPLAGGGSLNDCVQGVVRTQNNDVIVLAPERLLLKQEHIRLARLREAMAERLTRLEAQTS